LRDKPIGSRPGEMGNGFVSQTLKFGSEGIGPGMMTDARSIAGRWSGKHLRRRIQRRQDSGLRRERKVHHSMDRRSKDASARFSGRPKRNCVRGAARNHHALRRSTPVIRWGRFLIQKEMDSTTSLRHPTADSVAAWQRGNDDIVQFDSQGNIKQIIRKAISTPADRTELNTRVAVDGRGNIYGLGSFTSSVFKFSRDGKYMNRFGGPGRQPGQLSAVSAIAVDGKGRVFVSDIQGIQVFDADGRFVTSFRLDGPASGMTFNDQNELLVVARNKVMKYTVSVTIWARLEVCIRATYENGQP
jgi:hypothetical protein